LRVYYKIKSYLLNITTTLELLRYDQEMRGWL
jgi:hypothetical protein